MIFLRMKNSLSSKRKKSNKKSQDQIEDDFDPNPMLNENGIRSDKFIGKGHFSNVYSGYYHDKTPVAIKIIKRGNDRTEENELEILKKLKGKKHIVQLYDGFIEQEHAIFVFEKIDSLSENEILSKRLTIEQIRFYLKCVLEALREAHRMSIIHRDLRFQNVLVNKKFDNVTVIDWGCGTKISSTMGSSAGSRSTRSPEMLMGYNNYETKGDVWSVGALILYILTDGNIPWDAKNTKDALIKMAKYFGAQNILNLEETLHIDFYAKKLHKHINDEIIPISSTFSPKYADLNNKDLIDLINKCFILDYRLRPKASDLLDHEFFKA